MLLIIPVFIIAGALLIHCDLVYSRNPIVSAHLKESYAYNMANEYFLYDITHNYKRYCPG